MKRRNRRRVWYLGCIPSLVLASLVFVWLFASTNQMPTMSIVTDRTVLALHGPLDASDAGVKAAWEALVANLQSERMPVWRILKWLGIPHEISLALYGSLSAPSVVIAVNFNTGYRLIWLGLRVFGKHYKGAHYLVLRPFVFGMLGGTVIIARDEVTFCHAVDNIAGSKEGERHMLKISGKLRDRYDFVGFIKPQIIATEQQIQIPANLGEIGVDVVDANNLRGSVFWVCQTEREAEVMLKALERIESKLAVDFARKGVKCSFKKQREGMFVWWEFRLTNFWVLGF